MLDCLRVVGVGVVHVVSLLGSFWVTAMGLRKKTNKRHRHHRLIVCVLLMSVTVSVCRSRGVVCAGSFFGELCK